jgi:hypothetical protein
VFAAFLSFVLLTFPLRQLALLLYILFFFFPFYLFIFSTLFGYDTTTILTRAFPFVQKKRMRNFWTRETKLRYLFIRERLNWAFFFYVDTIIVIQKRFYSFPHLPSSVYAKA